MRQGSHTARLVGVLHRERIGLDHRSTWVRFGRYRVDAHDRSVEILLLMLGALCRQQRHAFLGRAL